MLTFVHFLQDSILQEAGYGPCDNPNGQKKALSSEDNHPVVWGILRGIRGFSADFALAQAGFFNPSPSMLPLTLLQTSFQIFQEKK